MRIEHVAAAPEGVGATLVDLAERHGAVLIVAGGFGHMRLAETLFGGVTRGLLTGSPCPIFMVHWTTRRRDKRVDPKDIRHQVVLAHPAENRRNRSIVRPARQRACRAENAAGFPLAS